MDVARCDMVVFRYDGPLPSGHLAQLIDPGLPNEPPWQKRPMSPGPQVNLWNHSGEELELGQLYAIKGAIWQNGIVLRERSPIHALSKWATPESEPGAGWLELFCGGIGSWTFAAKQIGLKVVRAVDNSEEAIQNYAHNHGDGGVCADVINLSWTTTKPFKGIAASPPCPAFSVLKGCPGFDDRSALPWKEFLEILRFLQVEWVLVENVSTITNKLSQLRTFMKAAGYQLVSIQEVRLQDFAPFARSRAIMVWERCMTKNAETRELHPWIPRGINVTLAEFHCLWEDGAEEGELQLLPDQVRMLQDPRFFKGRAEVDPLEARVVTPAQQAPTIQCQYGQSFNLPPKLLSERGLHCPLVRTTKGKPARLFSPWEIARGLLLPEGLILPRDVLSATRLLGNTVSPLQSLVGFLSLAHKRLGMSRVECDRLVGNAVGQALILQGKARLVQGDRVSLGTPLTQVDPEPTPGLQLSPTVPFSVWTQQNPEGQGPKPGTETNRIPLGPAETTLQTHNKSLGNMNHTSPFLDGAHGTKNTQNFQALVQEKPHTENLQESLVPNTSCADHHDPKGQEPKPRSGLDRIPLEPNKTLVKILDTSTDPIDPDHNPLGNDPNTKNPQETKDYRQQKPPAESLPDSQDSVPNAPRETDTPTESLKDDDSSRCFCEDLDGGDLYSRDIADTHPESPGSPSSPLSLNQVSWGLQQHDRLENGPHTSLLVTRLEPEPRSPVDLTLFDKPKESQNSASSPQPFQGTNREKSTITHHVDTPRWIIFQQAVRPDIALSDSLDLPNTQTYCGSPLSPATQPFWQAMEPDPIADKPQHEKKDEEPAVAEALQPPPEEGKKETVAQDEPETRRREEDASRPRKGKSKGKGKKGKPGKSKGKGKSLGSQRPMTPPKASPGSTPRSPGPYTPGTSASNPRTPMPAVSLNPSRVLNFEVRNDSMKIKDMVKVHASAPLQLIKTTYMTSATMKISISYKHVSVAAHCKVSAIKDAAWLYMEYMPGPPAGPDYSLRVDTSLLRQAAKALWLKECPSPKIGRRAP